MEEPSKQIFLSVTLGIIVAGVILFFPVKTVEYESTPTPLILATSTSEVEVQIKIVPDSPIQLKKIAWCESRNRQFLNGETLRGRVNPDDLGKHQINDYYHGATAERLGMDLHTLAGNTEYANWLYETQGSSPWGWSEHCWGDSNRVWWEEGGDYWSSD
jgi:hypothetical protein